MEGTILKSKIIVRDYDQGSLRALSIGTMAKSLNLEVDLKRNLLYIPPVVILVCFQITKSPCLKFTCN